VACEVAFLVSYASLRPHYWTLTISDAGVGDEALQPSGYPPKGVSAIGTVQDISSNNMNHDWPFPYRARRSKHIHNSEEWVIRGRRLCQTVHVHSTGGPSLHSIAWFSHQSCWIEAYAYANTWDRALGSYDALSGMSMGGGQGKVRGHNIYIQQLY
jgi:hypothetical protein